MRANEIIPTITVTKRFLEIIALIKVGKDARRFSQLMLGRCPKCWVKSWLNHKADIITIGTKLRYSITIAGKENFFFRKLLIFPHLEFCHDFPAFKKSDGQKWNLLYGFYICGIASCHLQIFPVDIAVAGLKPENLHAQFVEIRIRGYAENLIA